MEAFGTPMFLPGYFEALLKCFKFKQNVHLYLTPSGGTKQPKFASGFNGFCKKRLLPPMIDYVHRKSYSFEGYRWVGGSSMDSLIVRGETKRKKMFMLPALSLVPEAREPPKGC